MSEATLWNRLRDKMIPDFWSSAHRHEDRISDGIADVSFCQDGYHGWMELKHLHDWPVRPTTVVRCKHYTDEQRMFLKDKGEGGGNTWLFAQIAGDHVLLDYRNAQAFGTVTKEELIAISQGFWEHRLNYEELAIQLRRYYP